MRAACRKAVIILDGAPVCMEAGWRRCESLTKPAEGALVILRPQQDANPDDWSAGFPRANVGADGKFEVGTYGDNDGAPAGDYIVLVSWIAPNPQNEEASGPDRLGGRYSDPAT